MTDSTSAAESKKRFQLFNLEATPDGSPRREPREAYAIGMMECTVAIKAPQRDGLMLFVARFKPGFYVPKHSHDVDHIALVMEGEQHFGGDFASTQMTGNLVRVRGKLVLTKGQGYQVKADNFYGPFWAGPDGLVLAEFRAVSEFGTKYADYEEVARLNASRLMELQKEGAASA